MPWKRGILFLVFWLVSPYLGHFTKVWETWVHILHLLELDRVWKIRFSSPVRSEDFLISSSLSWISRSLFTHKDMGQNQTANLPAAQEIRNTPGDVNSSHIREAPAESQAELIWNTPNRWAAVFDFTHVGERSNYGTKSSNPVCKTKYGPLGKGGQKSYTHSISSEELMVFCWN